jgi:hypothetical protein
LKRAAGAQQLNARDHLVMPARGALDLEEIAGAKVFDPRVV